MELAIQVHRLNVTLKNGSSEANILKELNLVVPKGAIFGLLGPSGCGKTTLLKCLVGSLAPNEGMVRVFGEEPGDKFNKSLVGFMPQELALYDELTVDETLQFFGHLYCMQEHRIELSIQYLIKFLNLTEQRKQIVATLSGGQKRRLSLATALIHEPKLAILDEPTVGVDPVLSDAIWNHLTILSKNGMTIIITTHYINEAKDTSHVAFMRDGSILTQGPLAKFRRDKSKSLEKVFLDICIHNERQKSLTNGLLPPTASPDIEPICKSESEFSADENRRKSFCTFFTIVLALLWKSWIRMKRLRQPLIWVLFIPASQIVLFCICTGNDPMHIQLAIVNEEKVPVFSSMFLEKIPPFTVHQKYFKDMESAVESVRRTESWAVIHIPPDFTVNLQKRLFLGSSVNSSVIQSTIIKLYPDLTNKYLSAKMTFILQEALGKFHTDVVGTLGLDTSHSLAPIEMSDAIYNRNPNQGGALQFLVPGMIASISFSTITGITALAIVMEQTQGLICRILNTGATMTQIMLATSIVHVFIVIGQIAVIVPLTFLFFEIESKGPIYLSCILFLLQGIAGVTFGLVIAAFCKTESGALATLLGTLFPNLILSGIIWPVTAIPIWVRWLSYVQPTTLAINSLRNIMLRGWNIDQPGVYHGFLSTIAFATFFFLVALKFK